MKNLIWLYPQSFQNEQDAKRFAGLEGRIVVQTPQASRLPKESDDTYIERVASVELQKGVPQGALRLRNADLSELPDLAYQEAFEHDGNGGVVLNIERARVLHLDRIRARRNFELKKLDEEQAPFISRALAGDRTGFDQVEAKKQAMRDLPETLAPRINAAATAEELKAVKPF
jgi:hypothetical protein